MELEFNRERVRWALRDKNKVGGCESTAGKATAYNASFL